MIDDRTFAATSAAEGGTDSALFVISADSDARLAEVASYQPEGQFASAAVVLGDMIYGIVRNKNQDSIVALRSGANLEAAGTAQLDAKCVDGPWTIDDRLVMVVSSDRLVSVAADLNPQWSIALPNDKLAFPPTMTGRQLMIGFQSGLLVWLNPATGEAVNQQHLGQPIDGTPLLKDGRLYFGGMDGTVHEVDPSAW